MNIFNILCCLALMAAGRNQAAFCMDTPIASTAATESAVSDANILSLPDELWAYLALAGNTDGVSRESFFAHLMKLREVCTTWRDRLTNDFIADLVDVHIKAESYQELETCLAQAVTDENVVKIVMICKLYPNVSRVKAVHAVFSRGLAQKCVIPKYLRVLLALGTDPNMVMHEGKDSLFSYTMSRLQKLHLYMRDNGDTIEAQCIDLLLKYKANTGDLGLLEDAVHFQSIYAMYRLLQSPLHSKTNYTDVLAQLCCHCYKHEKLMDVVDALLAKGATVTQGNRILEKPVNEGILPMVHVLLKGGATVANTGWLCAEIINQYPQWPDQAQAKILVPEIIELALTACPRYPLVHSDPHIVLNEILREKANGTYYFTGPHFYPCIKKLMETGLDPLSDMGNECIYILLDQADPQIIDLFLELKFPMHSWRQKHTQKTALHLLAHKRNIAAIKKILTGWTGPIDIPDLNGKTPLECAMNMRAFDTANILMEFGADIRNTERYMSGNLNTDEQCIYNLCNGMLPVAGLSDEALAANVYTIYRKAEPEIQGKIYDCIIANLVQDVLWGRPPAILKVLCEKYPEFVHAVDHNGDTMLHYAVKHLKWPLVQNLIEQYGVSVNVCNVRGQTPLELLPEARWGSEDGSHLYTKNILVKHGAHVQSVSNFVRNQQPINQTATLDVRRVQARSQLPQPTPRPDETGTVHAQKLGGHSYKMLAGLSLAAITCYGFYRYWYPAPQEDDEREEDAQTNQQLQES